MRVVVVGGGFGGVKAALELSKRQIGKVTLISDQPYFLHHATLYATATGKSTEESVIPLNVIFRHHPNVEVVEDYITDLDPHRKLIRSQKNEYHYDTLILALGSSTDFKGIKGLERHSYGIKTLEEVREFQSHIQDEVVQQKLDKEYFIIGAGPTGVEMAGALNEHLKILKSLHRLKGAAPRVTLVEAGPRIVPDLSRSAARKIHHELQKQGVKILVNKTVSALNSDTITIDGRTFSTQTALWTSGTTNSPFYAAHKGLFTLTQKGQVEVNPYLEALDGVYVIGDNNDVKYSGMALPAIHQATHVAKTITRIATKRVPRKFRPTPVPVGVPIGAAWAYVEWRGIYQTGRLGMVLRRGMELYGYCQLVPFSVALPIWRSHSLHDVDDIY